MNQLTNLICSALVACALLVHTASGYVTGFRSVKHCVDKPVSAEECDDICLNRAHNIASPELVSKFIAELKTNAEGNQQCCCKYDDTWDYSDDDSWDPIKGNQVIKTNFALNLYVMKRYQPPCSKHRTIFISSNEESEAYKNMCKYVRKQKPLSILELGEYIDAVSYLRELTNRNPLVSWKLGRIYVPKFTTDLKEQFYKNIDSLLDHPRDFQKPGGPPFELDMIQTMSDVSSKLRLVFDCDVVHRSFDELIISMVMISVIDAEKWLMKINDGSMSRKLFHSLRGNGDEVDPKTANVVGFSCEKFKEARDIATNLLDTSRSALSRLNSKLAFEAMTREWRPMMKLDESIEVYNNLIESRCTNIDANTSLWSSQLAVTKVSE